MLCSVQSSQARAEQSWTMVLLEATNAHCMAIKHSHKTNGWCSNTVVEKNLDITDIDQAQNTT